MASSSGDKKDLDFIEISENIEMLSVNGNLLGLQNVNTGYISASLTTHDHHAISDFLVASPGGKSSQSQTFMFCDSRTKAQNVPMKSSGYLIGMEVFFSAGYNKWLLHVSKEGAATRANSITSAAGGGGLISRTIGE